MVNYIRIVLKNEKLPFKTKGAFLKKHIVLYNMSFVKAFRPSFLENEVLKKFSTIIEKEVTEAIQIVIFGSRARGDSNEGSDLDIAIIFNMPYITEELWKKIWNIKWSVLESLDAEEFPLSLTLITMKDLESRDFGIENVIKKEGMVIWKRQN